MEIKISGKECEKVLTDYAFTNFGKLLGCEKIEDIATELDVRYSAITGMVITKKEIPAEKEIPTKSEA